MQTFKKLPIISPKTNTELPMRVSGDTISICQASGGHVSSRAQGIVPEC